MKNRSQQSRVHPAHLFTYTFVKALLESREGEMLASLRFAYPFLEPAIRSRDYVSLFERAYEFLSEKYMNEYVFQNSLYNHVFRANEARRDAVVLHELRSGSSIADIVSISRGEALAFEIKSDLDNEQRAVSQVEDYYKIFPAVAVLSTPKKLENLSTKLSQDVGLYCLDEKLRFSVVRKPTLNYKHLDVRVMFNTLRTSEYISVIEILRGEALKSPSHQQYDLHLEVARSVPLLDFSRAYFEVLARRATVRSDKRSAISVPRSISFLVNKIIPRVRVQDQFVSLLQA